MPPIQHQCRVPALRRGVVYRPVIAFVISATVLAGLIFWLSRGNQHQETLTVYCAAGLREPMEAIRMAYEAERGVAVAVQYGGSSTLLGNLRFSQEADGFLPWGHTYIDAAMADNLVSSAE